MDKIAVFPGSFDPITVGHESIIKRALPLFDKIIVAIGYNSNKEGFFPLEKRINWIKDVFKDENKIVVDSYEGLTVDYLKKTKAKYILRGLRTSADFEYERAIAQTNKYLDKNIETVFFLSSPEHTPINSTIIREVVRHGGDASQFVPKAVKL